MQIKSQKFVDPQFHSVVDRMEGALELIIASGEYKVISATIAADNHRFYGTIFYQWVGK